MLSRKVFGIGRRFSTQSKTRIVLREVLYFSGIFVILTGAYYAYTPESRVQQRIHQGQVDVKRILAQSQQAASTNQKVEYVQDAMDVIYKLSPIHPDLYKLHFYVAGLYEEEQRYYLARQYYQAALEVAQASYRDTHRPSRDARRDTFREMIAYDRIGGTYFDEEKVAEAISSYEKAVQIYQHRIYGKWKLSDQERIDCAGVYHNFSTVVDDTSNRKQSLSEESHKIWKQ